MNEKDKNSPASKGIKALLKREKIPFDDGITSWEAVKLVKKHKLMKKGYHE